MIKRADLEKMETTLAITLYNTARGHGGVLFFGKETDLIWDEHDGKIHLTENGKMLGVFDSFTKLRAYLVRLSREVEPDWNARMASGADGTI